MCAKKQFGQHFLRDSTDSFRIAELLADENGAGPARILEIGPGKGALTSALLERWPGAEVTAVEFDRDMVASLGRRFAGTRRLIVQQGDILKFDPGSLGAGLRVAGNLPYNLSAPIIEWTVANRETIYRAVYMLQREVAKRLVSTPGGKDWSPLAIMTQLYFEVSCEFDLEPQKFSPPPKVHSSVVTLRQRDFFSMPVPPEFERVVRAGFAQRRKQLVKNLEVELKIERPALLEALEKTGLAPDIRAEQVTMHEFAALAGELSAFISN